jgi:predicted ribosome quality control (RQC) complex YloA/Tae2 family protein
MSLTSSLPVISLSKCWQTDHGTLVFQASIFQPTTGEKTKGYLTLDAAAKTNNLLFSTAKPTAELKSTGAAAIIRKYCSSCRLINVALSAHDREKSFLRLRLMSNSPSHDTFLVVSAKPTAEIDFILNGVSLCRLQPKGTFTVKKTASSDVLEADDFDEPTIALWLKSLLSLDEQANLANQPQSGEVLSAFRRQSRDKIARRLKTLRKTLDQDLSKLPSTATIKAAKKDAELLSSNLWRLKKNSEELIIEDTESGESQKILKLNPSKTPGENLELFYTRIKKLERASKLQSDRVAGIKRDIQSFEEALTRLRDSSLPMTDDEITSLLSSLLMIKPKLTVTPTRAVKTSKNTLGRRFSAPEGAILILGRDAKESDQIVKAAKSSDWWVHIAGGGRGSHVLVTGLSSKSSLDPNIMRSAGILALHFSDRSKAREGDVYCTRRQFIRKTKGLPPGLWLVDKSETFLIRYEQEELADIFSKEIRDGIQRHRPQSP